MDCQERFGAPLSGAQFTPKLVVTKMPPEPSEVPVPAAAKRVPPLPEQAIPWRVALVGGVLEIHEVPELVETKIAVYMETANTVPFVEDTAGPHSPTQRPVARARTPDAASQEHRCALSNPA